MQKKCKIEVTAQDVYSVKSAIIGGADRIELCTALGVAGLTPSIGLIESAVNLAKKYQLNKFVDVLIRPREGDFFYDDDEIETCLLDIKRSVEAGVDGIVIGVLNKDNTVNKEAVLKMIEAAGNTDVTFNRAFDVVDDQFIALEQLVQLGIKRILTSGGAPITIDGINIIKELVNLADGKIEIMAGGGVKVEDIPLLVDIGVDAIHTSAKVAVTGGPNRPGENASYWQATVENVKKAVKAVHEII